MKYITYAAVTTAIFLAALSANAADSHQAASAFKPKLPLYFEKNDGQVDRQADFLARMPGATLFLTGADAVLVHSGQDRASALRLHWVGAGHAAAPQGEARMPGKTNYLIGNDQSAWHTGVANFERVRQRGLYPGIDLVYYGNQEQLEYDLTVQAGGDPTRIRLAIEGAKKINFDPKTGDLVLVDASGSPLRLRKPSVYQAGAAIAAKYALSASHAVSFELGPYDHTKPLVIDPEVVYSTVFGGTTPATAGYGTSNLFEGMAVDPNGFVYLSGITTTINVPTTTGSFQPACNSYVSGAIAQCNNFFVAKFDPTQSGAASLVYATYVGGNSTLVEMSNLAVDANGDAYFGGQTSASNYPTTSNGYAPACNLVGAPTGSTCPNSVLSELNPAGSALLYSTWLEPFVFGSALGAPSEIAVDGAQNAYIVGGNADLVDYYLAAFATTASGTGSLLYATGIAVLPTSLAVDPSGNAYVGGNIVPSTNGTNGTQFINFNGAETSVPLGDTPGVLVRFNTAGANTYATMLGLLATVHGVSCDSNGTAYVTGNGSSVTQVNGLPSGAAATSGAFVSVIDTTQTGPASLVYSTYISSTDPEGTDYAISSNGTGQFAFTLRGIQANAYPLVNPIVQPTITPEEVSQGYPYVGMIDINKSGQNALIFLSPLDGVGQANAVFLDQGAQSDVRGDTQGLGQSNNVYVGGTGVTNTSYSPFLSVPASYSTSLTPQPAGDLFFYKIGLGPVDEVTLSPAILNFPAQEVGTTSPALNFTATNTSAANVNLQGVTVSSQFNETDNCTGVVLTPGAFCTVAVTFEPTVITANTAFPTTGTVSLAVLDSSIPLAENVTGIGVSASTPTAFFTPQSIAFAPQADGSISGSVQVTLINTGSVALSGEGGQILDLLTYGGEFKITSTTCGTTLAVGANCQAYIAFAPTTASAAANPYGNTYSDTLYAYFNNNYEALVTLTGTGIPPASTGTLSATSITFAATNIGTPVQKSVTLTNTGTSTLTAISVGAPIGPGSSSYMPSGGCVTVGSLGVGGSCTLTITFDPQLSGALTASVTISANSVPPIPTLSLSGTGVLLTQTITFGALSNQVYGATPPALSATASSGLAVTFSSTTPSVCTVAGDTITLAGVGSCTITASQSGNSTYAAAASVNQSFSVTKANQTISFGALSNQNFGAAPFTVSATASSGLKVSFTSLTTGVCKVSGTTVTLAGVGTCTIQAAQAGNADYNPATSVPQSFTVSKGNQTITFGTLSGEAFGDAPFTVSATANSGLAVSFSSETTSVCTVSGDTVTLVAPGTCTIQATQAGNADWNAAPSVSQSFTVSKGSQTISFGTIAGKTFGSAPFTVSATATSGLAVSFNSQTTSVCTVSGDTVTLVAPGTCTVQAKQAGNADWKAAPSVNQSFTVAKESQTITFGALSGKTFGNAPFTVSATASSGLAVSFNSQTTGVCTVSGDTVTLVAPGTCTIQATQAGNATYAAAPSVNQSFTVAKESQTITFGALSGKTYGNAPFTVSATASSGLTVSFNSKTTSVCTVSGTTVTIVSGGTCTIQATQAGNATYAAAPSVSQSFTVAKENQTISFGSLAGKTYGNAPFTVSATASSGLAVSFNSQTTGVCTVSGSTVTIVSGGTCTVQATQAGNADFNAAPSVSQSFTVAKENQTITFGALSNQPFGAPVMVSATASSGLAVSFNSQTSSVCTVSGSTVTLVATGTCTIQATQSGNSDYNSAPSVNQSFTVSKGSQTITFGSISSQGFGTPVTVSATASSGLAVSFNSKTSSVCTVSGTTVTLVALGTCTIQATQSGNSDWNSAPSVSQSFTVNKGNQTITFGPLLGKTYGNAPFSVSATATSGLAVSFNSQTTSVCTISLDTVTIVEAGTCTIQATQAGNSDYNAAPAVNQSFKVAKENQTITFGALANKTLGAAAFKVSATASSGLAVSFNSQTTSTCTVLGNTVTLVAAGTCTIEATQAGNVDWNAATAVDQSFTITP